MNAITPINEARLQVLAPSVFASQAHESRSERYGYVNTIALIRALVERGFDVSDAKQSKTRVAGKENFTKHVVRLRHLESFRKTQEAFEAGREVYRGDTHTAVARAAARSIQGYGEVVLTNSHDGTSAVILCGGILRPDCFNGLFVSDATIASIHVTHSKRLIDNVIDGAFTICEQLPKALEVASDWNQLQLERPEQIAFAEAARVLRFGDAEGNVASTVTAEQLLRTRRDADVGADLWKTFNVVQENVIRGGLADTRPGYRDAETNRWVPAKRLKTRAVNGIDGDAKLNKALWTLAQGLAAAKAA